MIVFDARNVGQGASQASAGVLAPYIEGHDSSVLRDLGRRSLDLYDAFMRALAADAGDVPYSRSGTLEVALNAADIVRLQASGNAWRAQHVDARWLDADELIEHEPSVTRDAFGGLLIPAHGFVGVPDLVTALGNAAIRRGADIRPSARVRSVGPAANGRVAVDTDGGGVEADHVILAAGSWSGQVRIEGVDATVPVSPVRGQILHLSLPTPQPLRRVVWGTQCYIVPWVSGRVLVGATVEHVGFDESATTEGVRALLDAGCTLVPALAAAAFAEVRVGLRPGSPDGLPVLGRSQAVPGLLYATGHYRNGVLLAPITAEIITRLVAGGEEIAEIAALSPLRLGYL